jgi:hypothetical protein
MGEAYGGGILGRAEQFFDAIPGGMRGPQAPIVRFLVGAGIGYAATIATSGVNPVMFHEDGTPKPWLYSADGQAAPENATRFHYLFVPLATGFVCSTFV